MSRTSNFSDEYSSSSPTQTISYKPQFPSPNPPLSPPQSPPLSPLQSPPSSINRSKSCNDLSSSSLEDPPPLSKSQSEHVPRSGIIYKSKGLNVDAEAFYPEAFYQGFSNTIYPEFYFEHPIYEAMEHEVSPNFTNLETFAPPGWFAMEEAGGDCIPNHTFINENEEMEINKEMSKLLDSAWMWDETHQNAINENSIDSPGYFPQKLRFARQRGVDYTPNHTFKNENEEMEVKKKMSELFDSVNNNYITYEQYAWIWDKALQNAKTQDAISEAQYAQKCDEALQNAKTRDSSAAQYAQEWDEAFQNAKNQYAVKF